jgi:hypothetical protein
MGLDALHNVVMSGGLGDSHRFSSMCLTSIRDFAKKRHERS